MYNISSNVSFSMFAFYYRLHKIQLLNYFVRIMATKWAWLIEIITGNILVLYNWHIFIMGNEAYMELVSASLSKIWLKKVTFCKTDTERSIQKLIKPVLSMLEQFFSCFETKITNQKSKKKSKLSWNLRVRLS